MIMGTKYLWKKLVLITPGSLIAQCSEQLYLVEWEETETAVQVEIFEICALPGKKTDGFVSSEQSL